MFLRWWSDWRVPLRCKFFLIFLWHRVSLIFFIVFILHFLDRITLSFWLNFGLGLLQRIAVVLGFQLGFALFNGEGLILSLLLGAGLFNSIGCGSLSLLFGICWFSRVALMFFSSALNLFFWRVGCLLLSLGDSLRQIHIDHLPRRLVNRPLPCLPCLPCTSCTSLVHADLLILGIGVSIH